MKNMNLSYLNIFHSISPISQGLLQTAVTAAKKYADRDAWTNQARDDQPRVTFGETLDLNGSGASLSIPSHKPGAIAVR
jgi:hypothetical protein